MCVCVSDTVNRILGLCSRDIQYTIEIFMRMLHRIVIAMLPLMTETHTRIHMNTNWHDDCDDDEENVKILSAQTTIEHTFYIVYGHGQACNIVAACERLRLLLPLTTI